jgi:hypothetical protein
MCLKINIIQREFDFAFYDSTHLRKNIIRICKDHFALINDLNNALINVFDLINNLHINITNYEVVQKSTQSESYLQQNFSDQNENDQYFIDRQYRRKSELFYNRRDEYSNRRDEFRDSDKF